MRISSSGSSLTKEKLNKSLEPIENSLFNSETMPCIWFDSLNQLILETVGNPNIIDTVNKYCQNVSSRLELLTEIHSRISERKIKIRTTKIKKAIIKSTGGEITGDENEQSDSSSTF